MKIIDITSGLECKIVGRAKQDISLLTHAAQEATKNSIFFCLNGRNYSGVDWAAEAIKNGCTCIVAEQSISAPKKVTQIIVPSARRAMSQMAATFYGNPSKKLKIIGVTGTNGKTTTTNMIAHVLKDKYKVGVVGTNGVLFDDKKIETSMTTPDPILLQKLFAQMVDSGVEYVVMEMSAHAIYLQKLWGITSDIVAFTNLSQDHLDYFETMENYFSAKELLFTSGEYRHAVICTDTIYGQRLKEESHDAITCASKNTNADIFIISKEHTTTSQTFLVNARGQCQNFTLKMLGDFNRQNAIVAISCLLYCGFSLEEINTSLATCSGVDGRFESYTNGKYTIIIDYAHTPDGLENLLTTAREVAGKQKVICVFGCGGNRDTEKRPLMAAISEKLADYTIITTDNPRFEDPYKIAEDICRGFTKHKWLVQLDRGQALRCAAKMALDCGGIIVLAGKGAEDYLDIRGKKIDYSDKMLVQKVLSEEEFIV